MIKEGQTVHRTEVIDKSDKHKNILKIRQTNQNKDKNKKPKQTCMVHILDGSPEHGAHICISICCGHLVTSKGR